MHLTLCICALIEPLATRTRVVVLLHQLERDKPTNTGRLAARCLANSLVVESERWTGADDDDRSATLGKGPWEGPLDPPRASAAGQSPSSLTRLLTKGPWEGPLNPPRASAAGQSPSSLTRLPTPEAAPPPAWLEWATPGSETLLLFPHAEARPLEDWRGAGRPITLVVPDGTWRQAKKARRRVAGLSDLPCVSLPATGPSAYRLRHAARPNRLATIEAIARALQILEGPTAGDEIQRRLDHIFRVMVDRTLWTNGRISTDAVTGGIPPGIRSHDPLGIG
jgi:DTW domain-containing protein YfiP